VSVPPARLLPALACSGVLAAAAAAAPPPNVIVTGPGGQIEGGRLALDPRNGNRLAVVYWDERRDERGTCTIAVSSNGGAKWTSRPFAGAGSPNPLPTGMTLCRNPAVAFGPAGTLYVAYEVAKLSGYAQVELIGSANGGTSFGPPRLLDSNVGGGGDREPALAAGPRRGQVYVSFQRYTADEERGEVHVAASADGGATFSSAQVSPPAQNAAGSRAALAIDPVGTVYAAWVDGSEIDLEGGGSAGIEVASSTDGAHTFGPARAVASVPGGCGPNADCGNRYPDVTIAAPSRRRAVVAWSGAAFPHPASVSVARSGDGGRSWTAPKTLVASRELPDRDQHAPDLAVAPDGRLDLGYLEQARDAGIGLLDVRLVHSLDGGKTFSGALLLDDTPTASQRGDFAPAVSVGSSDAAALTAWIDGRRGNEGTPTTDVVFAARRDAKAPQRPRVRGPGAVRGGRVSVYRLSSADDFTPAAALRFRCALDGAPLRPCPARFTVRLAPGRHALRVRALDPAGNGSPLAHVRLRALPASPRPR
jgi:hypothetical protein